MLAESDDFPTPDDCNAWTVWLLSIQKAFEMQEFSQQTQPRNKSLPFLAEIPLHQPEVDIGF
jgi:hypothetical protein